MGAGRASPDTDNLIMLAKLYGMSLDELLNIKTSESGRQEAQNDCNCGSEDKSDCSDSDGGDRFQCDSEGFRFKDSEDKVHIGWNGIHVSEKNGDEVNIGWNGIHVKAKDGDEVNIGRKWDDKDWEKWKSDIDQNYFSDWKHYGARTDFPIAAVVITLYIILGFVTSLWHPLWIMLLAIPLFSSIVKAVRYRNIRKFSYFSLVLAAFLILGCIFDLWNPAWVLFVTVPLYHSLVNYFSKLRAKRKAGGDTGAQQETSETPEQSL